MTIWNEDDTKIIYLAEKALEQVEPAYKIEPMDLMQQQLLPLYIKLRKEYFDNIGWENRIIEGSEEEGFLPDFVLKDSGYEVLCWTVPRASLRLADHQGDDPDFLLLSYLQHAQAVIDELDVELGFLCLEPGTQIEINYFQPEGEIKKGSEKNIKPSKAFYGGILITKGGDYRDAKTLIIYPHDTGLKTCIENAGDPLLEIGYEGKVSSARLETAADKYLHDKLEPFAQAIDEAGLGSSDDAPGNSLTGGLALAAKYLDELKWGYEISDDRETLILKHGSAIVLVSKAIIENASGETVEIVLIESPVLREVKPSATAYAMICKLNSKIHFGALGIQEYDGKKGFFGSNKMNLLTLKHALLAKTLDKEEVETGVGLLMVYADEIDDMLQKEIGGKKALDK